MPWLKRPAGCTGRRWSTPMGPSKLSTSLNGSHQCVSTASTTVGSMGQLESPHTQSWNATTTPESPWNQRNCQVNRCPRNPEEIDRIALLSFGKSLAYCISALAAGLVSAPDFHTSSSLARTSGSEITVVFKPAPFAVDSGITAIASPQLANSATIPSAPASSTIRGSIPRRVHALSNADLTPVILGRQMSGKSAKFLRYKGLVRKNGPDLDVAATRRSSTTVIAALGV